MPAANPRGTLLACNSNLLQRAPASRLPSARPSHQARQRFAQAIALLLLILTTGHVARADDDFFEKEIRPLFVEHCQKCHGDEKQQGGLKLTSRQSLLTGGDSGQAVVPEKPDDSLLIRAVGYLDELKMPPKQKLPDAAIAKLKLWVAMGAPWPDSPTPPVANASDGRYRVTSKQQAWWAYQPVKDSPVPALKDRSWPRNEIDCFIATGLEAHGLHPTHPAEKRVWIRRATYDLTGLPPTPAEVDAFLADPSDMAYETVVDRLLASPTYGQRWARHWLDIVRYADFHDGNPKARTQSCEPLMAWRYRDWVVASLNRDLPFDQFIIHQIAGDSLPIPEGKEFYADGLIATTFLTNGSWDRGDADKEKMVSDMVDDNVDTIGKAFMGLTLGCARCHDHKFDPLSQHDYYALAGVFYSTRLLKDIGTKGGEYTVNRIPLIEKAYVEQRDKQVQKLNELNGKLAELDKKSPKLPDDDPERKSLIGERDQVQKELLPEPPVAEAATEGGTPGGLFPGFQDVPVHIRGSYTRLGPVVPRRMPLFFAGENQTPITNGSGRREVAAWVASKDNPLTARVIVNRIWQWHFGAGLVRTPNNFGLLSEPPTHPALLDWLATRFVEDGWSLKKLHRRIMLSATYGQSSSIPREQRAIDPENRWLGRFGERRLEAEAIRDAMLFVSGRLDTQPDGPASDDLGIARRSLYVQTARWDRNTFALLFDAANPDASDEKRTVSTVAPQSLFLLNHKFSLDHAKSLAERLLKEVPAETPNCDVARIQLAYQLLFSRSASHDEILIARDLVGSGPEGWIDLAHVLFCSNEFVYLD